MNRRRFLSASILLWPSATWAHYALDEPLYWTGLVSPQEEALLTAIFGPKLEPAEWVTREDWNRIWQLQEPEQRLRLIDDAELEWTRRALVVGMPANEAINAKYRYLHRVNA